MVLTPHPSQKSLNFPPIAPERAPLQKKAINITANLRTAAAGKGGTRKHIHQNKHEVVEPHARAVALHDPHTHPFPKPP